jgi:hypothetical protein
VSCQDLAHSDELWKPLCIARWPWLKSLKGGPAELLPALNEYKNQVGLVVLFRYGQSICLSLVVGLESADLLERVATL